VLHARTLPQRLPATPRRQRPLSAMLPRPDPLRPAPAAFNRSTKEFLGQHLPRLHEEVKPGESRALDRKQTVGEGADVGKLTEVGADREEQIFHNAQEPIRKWLLEYDRCGVRARGFLACSALSCAVLRCVLVCSCASCRAPPCCVMVADSLRCGKWVAVLCACGHGTVCSTRRRHVRAIAHSAPAARTA
jgi:hypothetical protein